MRVFLIVAAVIMVGIMTLFALSLFGAKDAVRYKLGLIRQSMIEQGYKPKWFIISERRSKLLNSILPNSARFSQHLYGNAIDVYIIDIDNDGVFTEKDIKIMKAANRIIEHKHDELKGAFGSYYHTRTSTHTIHIDVRGKTIEYEQK